ncbi:ABC transporter ATP-binding protein [Streptomyces sp. NPDC051018]|uniref:ABC transporter ATP-binding protein n=1 Tax=Streptomyces sp. NPDC051018 TaxID=3365639 RepID=UPI0037948627
MTTAPLKDAPADPAMLDVEDLSIAVRGGDRIKPILASVSLSCARGEIVGLVGESGSGKSMTLRTAVGLTPAKAEVAGRVRVLGRDMLGASRKELTEVRSRTASMIFQDPRAHINAFQRVGTFLAEGLRIHRGLSKEAAARRAGGLLEEVGLPDPARHLRQYPHEMSGGMLQRVMIAAALASEPDLLLADEPTTALDVTTQAEIMSILLRLRRERGLSIVLVTHDLDLAVSVCDRIHVMYAGSVVEAATAADLARAPRHPYTAALFAARPAPGRAELRAVPGRPLGLYEAGAGCAFAPRCPRAADVCRETAPVAEHSGGRRVACHLATGDDPGRPDGTHGSGDGPAHSTGTDGSGDGPARADGPSGDRADRPAHGPGTGPSGDRADRSGDRADRSGMFTKGERP